MPDFWDVRADGFDGAIYNQARKVAKIYFKEPIIQRIVDRVEWFSSNKEVYKIDYYGSYGYPFCTALLDEGKIVSKSYYSPNKKELIQLNVSNGVVSVFENGTVSNLFHSEEEFVKYYCETME